MNNVVLIVSSFVYFIIFIILLLNIKYKNDIIRILFMVFVGFLVSIVTITNDSIMDFIIESIIRFIYFPSISAVLVITFIALICFMYSLYNFKLDKLIMIVNYLYSCLIFVCYINFTSLSINSDLYSSIYTGDSLILIRIMSISTIVWGLIIFIRKGLKYIFKRV